MNEGIVGSLGKNKSATGQNIDPETGEVIPDELDEDIEVIKRKNQAVKADNINNVFMENINTISESVANFQQMEEETV